MLFTQIFTPCWKLASAYYNSNALKTKRALQNDLFNKNLIERLDMLQYDEYKT